MLNMSGMVRSPSLSWEVTLTRRQTLNAAQNARKRIEFVKAHNRDGAIEAALAANDNHKYFQVSSVREVR